MRLPQPQRCPPVAVVITDSETTDILINDFQQDHADLQAAGRRFSRGKEMDNQHSETAVRTKEKSEEKETFKNDLRVEKEIGNLMVYFLSVIGIAVGGLSLMALLSAAWKILAG